MRDRSPRGPPSASHASSSFPQTELIMCGVQASAPIRSRVRHAKIVAMSLQSPGKETGAFCSMCWYQSSTSLHQDHVGVDS